MDNDHPGCAEAGLPASDIECQPAQEGMLKQDQIGTHAAYTAAEEIGAQCELESMKGACKCWKKLNNDQSVGSVPIVALYTTPSLRPAV